RGRDHGEAGVGLERKGKEGADRLRSKVPLRQRWHGVGRVLLEQSDEIVEIKLFPCLHVAAEQPLLRGIRFWRGLGPTFGITFCQCLARPLQRAVDRGCRAAEQGSGFIRSPAEYTAEKGHGGLARRQPLNGRDKG